MPNPKKPGTLGGQEMYPPATGAIPDFQDEGMAFRVRRTATAGLQAAIALTGVVVGLKPSCHVEVTPAGPRLNRVCGSHFA